jgi:hypothetical protein
MSQQGFLKQHMSKGVLSPIMERTLESVMSPTPNKSFGLNHEQTIQYNKRGTENEERKLSGTGTYKIDAALNGTNQPDEDDDLYDEDCYSDDFEEDDSEDEALAMGSTGHQTSVVKNY